MKPALRYIPTEVWVDVFCYPWISREKLGRIVDKIGNFKFAEYLQFYLHDWGKRMLKEMLLDTFDEKKQPCIIPPQTPMPDNIKYFDSIKIGCFDSTTLDFLRRINTLFTGVNLTFDDLPPQLSTVLDNLLPLIHGIHSLTIAQSAIPHMEQSFGQKLAQVKMLTLKPFEPILQTTINFCINCLTSGGQRNQMEPKLLQVCISSEDLQQFLMAIQQQFHSAKSPSTFAIRFTIWRNLDSHIADFDLENDLGEQLHGQFIDAHWTFQISRHQPNAGRTLQEWVEETAKKSHTSRLHILPHLKIGPLDANVGANRNNAVEAETDDQPFTSGDKQ